MEKIKQALEKARRERASGGATASPMPPGGAPDADMADIQYTRTQIIEGSMDIMHEHRLITAMEKDQYTDSMKILGTQVLKRMEENGWSSIMVTSPRAGVGATTISLNLGLSIAKQIDYTVLTVDANLHGGNTHEYFGFQRGRGLSDYLSADIELPDILLHPAGIDHFVMLPAGTPSEHAPELLRSPKMVSLTDELASRYPKRIIIFDVPSVLDTAEALSLASYVDCVLVVVEDDETKQSDLSATIEMLSHSNIVGTVLNKAEYT